MASQPRSLHSPRVMRRWFEVVFAVVVLAGCAKDSKQPPTSEAPTSEVRPLPPPPADASAPVARPAEPSPAPTPSPPATGDAAHDFTPTCLALLVVGACGDGPIPAGFAPKPIAAHCKALRATQAEYRKRWVRVARPFFADKVPTDIPKKVVYPFAGGDLSTALTVYPDADEITTISLEPAGDPRTLDVLAGRPGELAQALGTVAYELRFLYRANFSNTMNMIDAMRSAALPTQLI